jgi:hypothetical protein
VVTICQSLGSPALLNLERDGVSIQPGGVLVNAAGERLEEGDWITISSRRQSLYRGKARYKPARLTRYMNGEPVSIEEDERKAFDDMAYALRYYRQLIRGLRVDQISKLGEVIRLVNLDLRGEAEEAVTLVQAWFDQHETFYMEEVLRSEMGDHLNQNRVFDMLSLDRKIRFFKQALAKCAREKLSGLSAGTFMLGRFISVRQPVAFWRSFNAFETALLLNEWILFEQYMQVLDEVGERKIMRARRRIASEGLAEIHLHPGNVRGLVPLKLSGIDLGAVRASLPEWSEMQTLKVVEILEQPYDAFFDFDAAWSMKELEAMCSEAGMPVPGPDDV